MGRAYERVMNNRKEMEDRLMESINQKQKLFQYERIDTVLRLPVNAATENAYKGINAMRLMQAAVERGISDNRWMTFNQAIQKGFKVKSGSAGVLCEHWTFNDDSEQDGRPVVSYYYVFNAVDIEGIEELPEKKEGLPEGYEDVINKELYNSMDQKQDALFINLVHLMINARYGRITKLYQDPERQDTVAILQKIADDKYYVPRIIKKAQEESDIISLRIEEGLLELSTKENVMHEDALEDLYEEENDVEVKTKIEDFGEKIGGARKELWSGRGLDKEDLLVMNSAEREKFITKDNIWKKPEYNKLIEEGMPLKVAYFIKTVRDKLLARPHSSENLDEREALQEEYISFVKDLRDCIMKLKTKEDVQHFSQTFLYDRGYVTREGYYGVKVSEKAKNCIDNKLFRAIQITSYTWDYTYDREIRKKQFGVTEEKKLPAGYEIRTFHGEFSVCKGRQIMANGFQTWEEAKEWITQNVKPVSRKNKFVPPQLEHIRRVSRPDIRMGKDITGENYLTVYGFYGGEFGNWMSEEDRQASLNMGYEAFYDLADSLEISYGDISLNGTLAIAFGARGHGNAVAHYEPMRKVINLTKMNGAGSLAHEWGHALDDYLGNALGYGKMLSEAKAKEFKEVMDAIKYRPATLEEQQFGKERVPSDFYLNSKAMDECTAKCDKGYWASDCEMFARAFACYVKDKLTPGKSDYLCGHAHACAVTVRDTNGVVKTIKAYPEGEDRERINVAISTFVQDMKTRRLLSDRKEVVKKRMVKSR